MKDDSRALLQHRRKKTAVQTHRRKKIQLEFLLPDLIRQRERAATRRGRTADAVDQNIQAAEPVEGCLDNTIRTRARTDVRLDELFGIDVFGDGSCRGEHQPSAGPQALHNRLANSLGSTRDEDSFTGEFLRCRAHTFNLLADFQAATRSQTYQDRQRNATLLCLSLGRPKNRSASRPRSAPQTNVRCLGATPISFTTDPFPNRLDLLPLAARASFRRIPTEDPVGNKSASIPFPTTASSPY